MGASLLPNGKQQFIDINGAPLVGGTVGMYAPGTLTPKTTWQDSGQTVLNANPIVIDSRGQALIYGGGAYRQIVKDALGNLIWDQVVSNSASVTVANYATVALATAALIDSAVTYLFIAGYSSIGDAQDILVYQRLNSAPATHSLWFQSADLAYWSYIPSANGVNIAAAGLVASKTAIYSATPWANLTAYAKQFNASTYASGGQPWLNIFAPSGNYNFNAQLTWDPTVCGVSGYGATFSFTIGVSGITVQPSTPASGQDYLDTRSVIAGLNIQGASGYTTEIGITTVPTTGFDAAMFAFRDCAIQGWQTGVKMGASSHNITLDHCAIFFNYYGVADTIGGTNEGENISFIGGAIFNCQVTGLYLFNVNASYFFSNCSIDYNGLGLTGDTNTAHIRIAQVGQLTFQGCHIETSTSTIFIGMVAGGNYQALMSGCAIIQVTSSGAIPFLDLLNGCYMTMIGNNCTFNNSTTHPIQVENGAALTDVGNIFAFGGSAINYIAGSRSGTLEPTTIH